MKAQQRPIIFYDFYFRFAEEIPAPGPSRSRVNGRVSANVATENEPITLEPPTAEPPDVLLNGNSPSVEVKEEEHMMVDDQNTPDGLVSDEDS